MAEYGRYINQRIRPPPSGTDWVWLTLVLCTLDMEIWGRVSTTRLWLIPWYITQSHFKDFRRFALVQLSASAAQKLWWEVGLDSGWDKQDLKKNLESDSLENEHIGGRKFWIFVGWLHANLFFLLVDYMYVHLFRFCRVWASVPVCVCVFICIYNCHIGPTDHVRKFVCMCVRMR